MEQRRTLTALITFISTLEHQHLSDTERTQIRRNVKDLLTECDRLGISWAAQNKAIMLGNRHDVRDVYVNRLVKEVSVT